MRLPATTALDQRDTVRLIPSQYSEDGDSVLTRIANDTGHLQAIFALDHATNDRLLAENDLLPGIGRDELVTGVPYYRTINAAFTHASPLGSRFNGPDRGCWYAGDTADTSLAEIVFHKTLALAEVDHFYDNVTYDPYLADLAGEFADIRNDPAYADCLDPVSYIAAQKLGAALLEDGALGVIYPSVRHPAGTCFACFRPALVSNLRRGDRLRLIWNGTSDPVVSVDPT